MAADRADFGRQCERGREIGSEDHIGREEGMKAETSERETAAIAAAASTVLPPIILFKTCSELMKLTDTNCLRRQSDFGLKISLSPGF